MYDTLEDFLKDNPGWIDKNERMPEDGSAVDVLDWMFGNFRIEKEAEYVSNGSFVAEMGGGYLWPLKVSHWRYHLKKED